MAMKTVSFSYTIGSARFISSSDISADDWDQMDLDDRVQHLETVAIDDVKGMLDIDENSIED